LDEYECRYAHRRRKRQQARQKRFRGDVDQDSAKQEQTSDECDALEGRIQHAIAAASSLYTHLITTPTPPRASKAPKVPKRSK